MKSPIDLFFKMGEKITKNDPKRKADWDFWLMVIMFMAFLSIGVGNLIQFFKDPKLYYLGWTVVMFAILWFQYFGLVQMYNFRKLLSTKKEQTEEIESMDEMIKGFNLEAKK